MTAGRDIARRGEDGFTLLEVLVALAVLAIALGALIKGVSDNAANATYLQEKTLANWVAMNKAAEIQLLAAWPDVGSSNGVVELAEREWEWSATVAETFDQNVRRLEVTVADARSDERKLAHLVAFLGRP